MLQFASKVKRNEVSLSTCIASYFELLIPCANIFQFQITSTSYYSDEEPQPLSVYGKPIFESLSETDEGPFARYVGLDTDFEITKRYIPPIMQIAAGIWLENFSIILIIRLIYIVYYNLFFLCLCSSIFDETTKEYVAVKKISNAFDNRKVAGMTLREIKFPKLFNHENVSEHFLFFHVFSESIISC